MPQPAFFFAQRLLELRPLHRQHRAQLGRRNLLLQERPDLLQRKAELLQRQNAIQPRQLPDAVVAIAGLRVDARRLQEAELIVESQLPSRDPTDLGKFTDTKHPALSRLVAARFRDALCRFDATSKSSGNFLGSEPGLPERLPQPVELVGGLEEGAVTL